MQLALKVKALLNISKQLEDELVLATEDLTNMSVKYNAAITDLENANVIRQHLQERIGLLEDNFSQSEEKLAQVVYHSDLKFEDPIFYHCFRGKLHVRKGLNPSLSISD